MRIGPKKELYNNTTLYDWVQNSGVGLGGIECSHDLFDPGIIEFIKSQLDRFSIIHPPLEMMLETAFRVLQVIDFGDPYSWFYGTTEVDMSPHWQSFTYEIRDIDGKWHEADPENLETFTLVPGQSEEKFFEIMGQPGLESLPFGLGDMIKSEFGDDGSCGENVWLTLPDEVKQEILRLGNVDAYFNLIIWASVAWFFGPPGKDFRAYNPIYEACFAHGECVLYKGFVYAREDYRKVLRPPQSCVVCGLDSWCVELVYLDDTNRYICEYHLKGKGSGPYTCGTRMCRYVECHHHPYYGQEHALLNYLRTHGQLARIDNENIVKQIA